MADVTTIAAVLAFDALLARRGFDAKLPGAVMLAAMRAAVGAAEHAAWRPISEEYEDPDAFLLFADADGMLLGLERTGRHPPTAAWWREVTFPTALLTPARDGEVCDG